MTIMKDPGFYTLDENQRRYIRFIRDELINARAVMMSGEKYIRNMMDMTIRILDDGGYTPMDAQILNDVEADFNSHGWILSEYRYDDWSGH